MKKTLITVLLILLTLGLFISCNGDVNEKIFSNSYKVQPDGSWKMGSKVYGPSTKPYILVLPKTLNVEKDVQLADLEKGLITLEEIESKKTATLGTATIAVDYDDFGNEFYNYTNTDAAQNIFMRTKDDYTETILLNAPNDEFSHYGSLNVATVDAVANSSYYEYGRVKKVILSLGHLVAKAMSQIDMIIVNATDPSTVSVDVETTNVKGIIAPEGVSITKPASVPAAKTEDAKFMDEDGKFYSEFADTKGSIVYLLSNVNTLEIGRTVEIDMFGSEIDTISITDSNTVTFSDSVGNGALNSKPEGLFKVKSGNYGFNPKDNLVDKEGTEAVAIEGTGYYKVAKKAANPNPTPAPEIPEDMFCFIAEKDGASVKLVIGKGSPASVSLVYSADGVNFQDYTIGDPISAPKVGDKVYFKAKTTNATFSKDAENYYTFVLTNDMSCSGNIMYLLDPNGESLEVPENAFISLFQGAKITTAPELPATTLKASCYSYMFASTLITTAPELPAENLAEKCYDNMFSVCTSLTTAPVLPAKTLVKSCYNSMFAVCTELTTAPVLPAETLAQDCYNSMFMGCTSLVTAPALPAGTLATGCYNNMFGNCTALTTAPDLIAESLADMCYYGMFKGCSSLNSVTMLATKNIETPYWYVDWLSYGASTGTLYVATDAMKTTLNDDTYRPSGWTVKTVWGVTGDFAAGSNWNSDVVMTETGLDTKVFVSPAITFNANEVFKIRLGGKWDTNYGIVSTDTPEQPSVIELGTAVTAIAGGKNMKVTAAGNYIITLDLNNTPTITVTAVTE